MAPARGASTPVTALVWDGSEGGSPGHGIDDTFRAGEAGVVFTVTGTSAGVAVHLHSSDALRRLGYAEVRLFPASGARLTPGTYDNVVPAFFGPQPTAGMWVASDNAGCDMTSGRFVIHEAVYESNTDGLRSLAATFEVGCSDKLIFGEIRYNSTVAWVSRHGAGVVVPFMTPASGQAIERTVTVTSDGSSALRTGAVRLEGSAGGFSVVRDGCSNVTLGTGAGCDVTVRYSASDPTARSATLVVPDNSARGARRWTLEGAVSSGPPPPNAPDPTAPSAAPTRAVFLDRSDWWPDQYRFVQTFRDGDPHVSFAVTGTAYGVHVGLTSSDPDVYGPGPFPIDLRLFPAKDGDTLRSGRSYIGATRWPFHEGAEPGMDLNVRYTGCNKAAGSFTIFDIGFDGNGQIIRLAAAWRFGCDPTDRFEAGEVRWNSTVPLAARSITPDTPGLGYYLTEQDTKTSETVTIASRGSGPLVIGTVQMSGDTDAFPVRSDRCSGTSLPPGATCTITIDYTPTDAAASYATLVIPDNSAAGGIGLPLTGQDYRQGGNPDHKPAGGGQLPGPTAGYWMVRSDGVVYGFGEAKHVGDAAVGSATAVDLEPTRTGNGYWIVDDLGRVFAFGDAVHRGNVDQKKLAAGEKATSLSATGNGEGYWIFTSRGRVLTFGNAAFLGDVSQLALAGPVLDSIVTPSGQGYYMVASDGGLFAFGDAEFFGSMGGQKLNAPVQSLVPDADGAGYWLVASDGGIFAFDAPFKGSMGGTKLNRPVTGMVRAGGGYLMVGEDGGIFDFSGTPDGFMGSLGANPPTRPITSVAVLVTR
jgi:hypothetical protein